MCAEREPGRVRGALCSVTPASHAMGFNLCQHCLDFREGGKEGGGERGGGWVKARKVQREGVECSYFRDVRIVECDVWGRCL